MCATISHAMKSCWPAKSISHMTPLTLFLDKPHSTSCEIRPVLADLLPRSRFGVALLNRTSPRFRKQQTHIECVLIAPVM